MMEYIVEPYKTEEELEAAIKELANNLLANDPNDVSIKYRTVQDTDGNIFYSALVTIN